MSIVDDVRIKQTFDPDGDNGGYSFVVLGNGPCPTQEIITNNEALRQDWFLGGLINLPEWTYDKNLVSPVVGDKSAYASFN